MRIQDNLGLIVWTVLDKAIYFLFGFVTIVIFNYTSTYEFGLYSLFVFLNSWIFTVGDSFALNIIIQYGMKEGNQGRVNTIATLNLFLLAMGISFLVYLFQDAFATLFKEPRFIEIAQLTPILSLFFIPRTFTLKLMYKDRNMKNVFIINLLFFGVISSLVLYAIAQNIALNFSTLSIYYIIGAIASSAAGLLLSRKNFVFSIKGKTPYCELYKFSWQIAYTNILHTIPKQIDLYIIKLFFTTEVVGLYSAAKSLYRLFDEAINAIYGLLYPSAVKLIQNNDTSSLQKLIYKSTSFIFWSFSFATLFILSPMGDYLLNIIFPTNYIESLYYFKLMIVVTPMLAFISFYSIITAEGKLNYLLKGVIFANLGFITTLLIVCFTNSDSLLPFGLIVFFGIFGFMGLYYGVSQYNYKFANLFVAFFDTYYYLLKIFNIKK